MLRAMPPPRRVRPLAGWSVVVVFLLIGIALLATVWTTRTSVRNASEDVGRGQAFALMQTVRADLLYFDGPPRSADLEAIVREHAEEGLRYLALLDGRSIFAEAGQSVGPGRDDPSDVDGRIQEVDGRLRIRGRSLRQMRGGGRAWRMI